jgi:hypothetical protein
MFNTKTRNTIVALVASLSVAGVAVVPTAAQAMAVKTIMVPASARMCHFNGHEYSPGEEISVDTKVLLSDGFHTMHETRRCRYGMWVTIEVGWDREVAPSPPSKGLAPTPTGSLPSTEGTPPSNSTKPIGSPLPLA